MEASVADVLRAHPDPAIAGLAARELGLDPPGSAADPLVSRLVAELLADPDQPATDPYKKFTGAHWRLLSLTELGVRSVTAPVEPLVEEV